MVVDKIFIADMDAQKIFTFVIARSIATKQSVYIKRLLRTYDTACLRRSQ